MTITSKDEVVLDLTDRLTVAIHRTGLKQGELAEYLGVNPATIWGWFNRGAIPRVSVMRALAERSGVPYAWLSAGLDVLPHLDSNQEPAD